MLKRIIYLIILSLIVSCDRNNNSPNIVFILTDDLGYGDLSSYGSETIETTNIDNYLDCNVQTDIIEYDSDQFDQDYTDTSDSSNNMFDHEHDYDFATDEHMDNYTTDDVMLGIFDDSDSKLSPSRVRADSFF